MNKLKALAGQTAIYGLSSIIGRFLNYLLVPLYTYNLPADQYGIVTELYTYVGFLIILLTYGMETGFFRFANQEKDYREVYTTSLLSLLGTSSLFILIIVLFNSNIAELIGYAILLSISYGLASLSVQMLLQRFHLPNYDMKTKPVVLL